MFHIDGRAPVVFSTMTINNRTETDGVEALYTYRQHQFANGGQLQWMGGARYVRFDDDFNVFGDRGLSSATADCGHHGAEPDCGT